MTPVMLMHPFRQDLHGKNIGDVRSPDGVPVYLEQLDVARQGGGFVNFSWAKPGADDPVQKVAYAAPYADWGWVIASGVYMDDVQGQAIAFTWVMTLSGGLLILLVLALNWTIATASWCAGRATRAAEGDRRRRLATTSILTAATNPAGCCSEGVMQDKL